MISAFHALCDKIVQTETRQDMGNKICCSFYTGLSVTVPGELIGLWESHKKFGALPWSELVETAIRLCEQGVVVSENLATFLHKFQDVVFADPTLR
jgi:gamma-glutamyltranspeptidase